MTTTTRVTLDNPWSSKYGRFSVQGTFIDAMSLATVETILLRYLDERIPRQIVTVNLDFLTIAKSLPQMQHVINRASLAVTDGFPLVWLARRLGYGDSQRITGPDLIEMAARLSVQRGFKLFLLGSTPEACRASGQVLEERFPGVQICGTFSPPDASYPFPDHLNEDICSRIRSAKPDILFVGFGCPKQEFWIRDCIERLDVPVCVGVGGSFNFLAGAISRAPAWMQRSGLEWVYRLWQEPRRLWRRYLLQDIPFVLSLGVSAIISGALRREAQISKHR
jgi:N-acetylglucosaminyldiphosphoundecaprenol N-acetyl-beta-D-mannosaminyltransferase